MTNEPFFSRTGGALHANPISRGPWDPKSLHGRVTIGLLAYAIETEHGDPDFTPARLTVDMYKLATFTPFTLKTTLVRDGKRIKVVDAEMFGDGVSIARATCQLLRRSENPPGAVQKRPRWDAPHPDTIAAPEAGPMGNMWETRPVTGGWGEATWKKLWMREVRCLVDDEPLTPFQRVALAADFTSPFAHAGSSGLNYINSDVTVYLARAPVGEWIGFESFNHEASAGVAIGECLLHDVEGAIGSASCAALAQMMRR